MIELDTLEPWTAQTTPGLHYFSGTATYTNRFVLPAGALRSDAQFLLDLGRVADMAEVAVNRQSLGLLWKPPYRIDITDALRAGDNELELRVTNQWINRIIGDRRAEPEDRVLSGDGGGGFGGGPAEPPISGLLGPVTVVVQTQGENP